MLMYFIGKHIEFYKERAYGVGTLGHRVAKPLGESGRLGDFGPYYAYYWYPKCFRTPGRIGGP